MSKSITSPLLLGIDTGGTYTDAVLVDQEGNNVVATAKALTTRHDLSIGIGEAIAAVIARLTELPASDDASGQTSDVLDRIGLVSMSTTLATNALVERHGGGVCLVAVGFTEAELDKAGLPEALGNDPIVAIAGGHSSHGEAVADLDLEALAAAMAEVGPVAGYAVVGQFGVRNPSHELAVLEWIQANRTRDGVQPAVTCSHELTAKLNGPKRAVTSVLNARLIGLITSLVTATTNLLEELGVDAPVMVVRGDGSLIAAATAVERPIETILSGPAASVVGARHLTGATDAIVSDIGGTTTDIAILDAGMPRLSAAGATVGGHQTMVEAVDMHTFGLGGDSEVWFDERTSDGQIRLGPRRVIPLSLLAHQYPDVVRPALDFQVHDYQSRWLSASFALQVRPDPHPASRTPIERGLLDALAGGPRSLRDIIPTKRHEVQLDGLVSQGLVLRSSFTPTDASLVLHPEASAPHGYDRTAAIAGGDLLSRLSDRRGALLASSPEEAAQRVLDALTAATVDALVAVLLERDGFDPSMASHPLVRAGLARPDTPDDSDQREANGTSHGHLAIEIGVRSPLVALGASAGIHYPPVARRLGAELVVHEHAGVANAVGAVVGRVRVQRAAVITRKGKRAYRTHVGTGPEDFTELEDAVTHVIAALESLVTDQVRAGGGVEPTLTCEREDNIAMVDGQEVFIDSTITVTGLANPALR